ncbi:MAG: hypothetical protein AAF196_01255 [Planctomycetota bacterium]
MHNSLLHLELTRTLDAIRAGETAGWRRAAAAVAAARPDDPEIDDSDLAIVVELEDQGELARFVEGWRAGTLQLPVADRAIAKRAMKALRKRLKLARLDDESSLGGSSLTSGRESGIVAVRPPEQYPREVWDLLLRQEKVVDAGHGMLQPVGE